MDSLPPLLEPCYRAKTILYPDGGVETVAYNPRSMPARGNPLFSRTKVAPRTPEEIADAERKQAECAERARRRAAKQVRVTARWLMLDRLLTFTTRELSSDYETVVEDWDRVRRLLSKEYPGFVYVAVPEPHPTRPGHYHIHVAVRGWKDANLVRRLWLRVLRRRGITGNIDIKRKAYAPERMARYLAKYFSKTWADGGRFGRKRYWSTRLDEERRPVVRRWTPSATNWRELEAEIYGDPDLTVEARWNGVAGVWWMQGKVGPPREGA